MSRDRFELIKRYIHFNDNNKDKRKQDENSTDYSRYDHCLKY